MENTQKQKNSYQYFNILKFISAVIIAIFLHWNDQLLPFLEYDNTFRSSKIWFFLTHNSYILTELFFMISGILFFVAYSKKIQRDELKFKKFIVNRIIRIFPVVIITSIFMYLANVMLYHSTGKLWSCGSINIFDLLLDCIFGGKNLITGRNSLNGPIWYISVLMVCYIIAYVLCKKQKKFGNLIYVIPIVIGITIGNFKVLQYYVLETDLSRGFVAFFVGIFLGIFLKKFDSYRKNTKLLIKLVALVFVVMYIVIFCFNEISAIPANKNENINFVYVFGVFTPLIILLYDINWLNKFCSTKCIKFLGNISFGIYLWNFPILITIHILYKFNIVNIDVYSAKFFIINLIIHIIVASLSYVLIDKPVGKIFKKEDVK